MAYCSVVVVALWWRVRVKGGGGLRRNQRLNCGRGDEDPGPDAQALIPGARRALLIVCGLILGGCASVPLITGDLWGYTARSGPVKTLRVLTYMADRPTCEVNRARDLSPPADARWADLKPPDECQALVISAASVAPDYWVFGIPSGRFGMASLTGGLCRGKPVGLVPEDARSHRRALWVRLGARALPRGRGEI
jgi:hypothetical protein